MMRCAPNCRDVRAKDLRSNLGGGQGKIYLRPIQKSLSTKPLVQENESAVKEKCYMCNKEILVRELRDHLWICTDALNSDNDDNQTPHGSHNANAAFNETTSISPTREQTSETTPIRPTREQISETAPIRPTREATGGAGNLAVPLVDLTERDDVRPTTTFQPDPIPDANENQSVDEVVGAVQFCQVNEIHNPVEILRCFQQKLVTGRALEVASAIEANEGDTNFIMVDRCNLSETAFEEIVSLPEYRKTLQVQFYGEISY